MRTRTTARVLAPAALVVAAVIALAGCAGAGPRDAPSDDATPAAGGNVTIAIGSDQGCVDPQQVGTNDSIAIARQTVASLTWQDPKTGAIQPWLATRWSVNDDATSFTFRLRKGATYADGTPIDAASVKANIAGIQALGAKATLAASYVTGLRDVKVVDPLTVRFTFTQPSAQFLQATSTFSLGLISSASTKLGIAKRCAGDFIGSGPFAVRSYTPDSSAVLTRVPGYDWAPSSELHTGAAYLKTVTFSVIPEAGTLTGALRSGQIDASPDVQNADLAQFEVGRFWETNRANPGVTYNLIPIQKDPILADRAVRLALQKAIDRTALTKLLTKYDKPATSVLASSTPYFTDQSSLLRYDPDAASRLLEEDGWKVGPDGVRQKDGHRLSFVVEYWQPSTEELELVQQDEKAIGVEIQLKFVTVAQWQTDLAAGTLSFRWGNLTRADPDVLRTVFSAGPGGNNSSQRAAGSVDDALATQAVTTATSKRQAAVDRAVKELITSGDANPVYQLSTTIVAGNRVHDLGFEASSRLDLYNTWVSR